MQKCHTKRDFCFKLMTSFLTVLYYKLDPASRHCDVTFSRFKSESLNHHMQYQTSIHNQLLISNNRLGNQSEIMTDHMVTTTIIITIRDNSNNNKDRPQGLMVKDQYLINSRFKFFTYLFLVFINYKLYELLLQLFSAHAWRCIMTDFNLV